MHTFRIKFSFLILVLLFSSYCFVGCKSKKIITKPEPEKVDSGGQEGEALDYDEAVKRHFDMQSDRTKSMMIRSDKTRKMKNSGKNRQWYDQLFNNSCFKNSAMVKTGHSYTTVTNNGSCFRKD